jgi:hypothetical protein
MALGGWTAGSGVATTPSSFGKSARGRCRNNEPWYECGAEAGCSPNLGKKYYVNSKCELIESGCKALYCALADIDLNDPFEIQEPI